VQVDPMQSMLKAPICRRLKLEHEKLLSNFAFRFNLRRYSEGGVKFNGTDGSVIADTTAGAYTRPLIGST